jgi:hypothetical protein
MSDTSSDLGNVLDILAVCSDSDDEWRYMMIIGVKMMQLHLIPTRQQTMPPCVVYKALAHEVAVRTTNQVNCLLSWMEEMIVNTRFCCHVFHSMSKVPVGRVQHACPTLLSMTYA